jgi:hypothetical protein
MIFLICALISLIIGVVVNVIEWGFDVENILCGILGALIGLLVALLLWLGICIFPGSNPAVVNTSEVEVYALADNARYSSTVSGSVFIVQSRTDEKLKYSYMYMCEGKGYGFDEVNAEQCYINYTEDTPKVIRQYIGYKNPVFRWLFPDIYEDEYIFYLPKDAQVINDFDIDFN